MMDYSKKQKIFRIVSIVAVLVFAIGGIFFYYSGLKIAEQNLIDKEQQSKALEASKSKENVFVSDVSIAASKESKPATIPASIPKSENFQMREVVFGGFENSVGGEMKDMPLKIYDVHSEVLASKDGKQAKLYIAWKTNKLAISQVVYAETAGVPNVLLENGLGFSHALIIGKFDFDTRYSYTVTAKDRWGNEASSDTFNAYSGKKVDSVLTLIVSEFKKMFSWADIAK